MTEKIPPPRGTHAYWDYRFSEPGFAYGEEPNDFLRASCQDMQPCEALTLCEGEGRNAVYLARLGFRVTAVDYSEVGLAKAQALAVHHGVTIHTIRADITDFDPGIDRWDLVVAIFAQPPAPTRQRLYRQLQHCLRPGGAFVLEAKADIGATGADQYPGVAILQEEIAPLSVAFQHEGERQLNEGRYHAGVQRTAQLLAFKR
jgi:SAM-dependent methyltransferase